MMDIPISALCLPEEFREKKPSSSAHKTSDEEILRELCIVNGISYEKLNTEGKAAEVLEAFFSGIPRFVRDIAPSFPNLVTLCFVGQDELSNIEHIGTLAKLEELWVAECSVKKITGIGALKRLEKLYLYGNKITTISGLGNLTNLQLLWLNTNSISSIQGLENLCKLKELNLAENKITSIGHSLDHCVSLETLEISVNCIDSFKDVTTLSRLPNLTQLGFSDAKFGANPICLLCNYITQVLYHLPNLRRLDGHDITGKLCKALAEATVLKKKMFYKMRLKVLQKTASLFIKKLTEFRDKYILKEKREQLTKLWQLHKQLQMEIGKLYKSTSPPENADDLISQMEMKLSAVKARIDVWEGRCAEADSMYEYYRASCQLTLSSLTDNLCLELESGGNIKFEIGSPNDLWFMSCYDLMMSRFCAADYKELGVQGIKIHRVTRVYNRMLRFRFDDKLAKKSPEFMSNSEDLLSRSSYLRNQMEYLFWIWDHELLGGKDQPIRILEEGFLDADSCQELNKHGAVPLSNCLSLADRARIRHTLDKRDVNRKTTPCPYRYGQVVIVKTFIGNSQQSSDAKCLRKDMHPGCDSVYRPRNSRPFDKFPRPASARIDPSPLVHDNNNPSKKCDCSSKQAEWYIFDHELVVPEYIIDFEYVTVLKPTDPYEQFDFTILDFPSVLTSPDGDVGRALDVDVFGMEPVELYYQNSERLRSLAASTLRSYLSVESLEHVTELNIHNQGITQLTGIKQMSGLKTLIASFNELSRLDDIVNMRIEVMDISFNKIITLDGMKNMNCLRSLDISWNCMRYIRDEFAILRKHAAQIEHLQTQHNLWLKPLDFRLRVIARMKSLQSLDGVDITESEATAALRLAAGARVSPVHILSHGRTDQTKPRSLSLGSVAQILTHRANRALTDRVSDSNSQWMTTVTALCLDNQHLSKLSSLDRLVNLKWASFCHNDIVKMEGLDECRQLEELYLDDNCIYKLEGLNKLSNLKRLSLSDNYLVQLDSTQLDKLPHLHYLALDHNKISSLSSIQRCKGLIELYMSQNRIISSRDAFFLKGFQNLLILDLCDNPVTETDNYRMFMIYHLSTLKAFDGVSVDAGELAQAREVLGGRLTSDFVAERVGHSMFSDIRELDVPQMSLRSIDLGNGEAFINLRSINLEHNNLTSVGGLVHLPNLRVLCLNHNKVECLTAKSNQSEYSSDRLIPVLESLEVLHLGYNGIKDLHTLQVSRLVNLKALFLQGNELQVVSGLEGLHDLRELVLDKNKIKNISETSFVHQWNLQELHIEENRIRELSHFQGLESLQRLYLGMNRIQDLCEVEKLSPLTQLIELSLVSCPVSRRLMHRPLLVYKMPSLAVIDGIPVTEEEQVKASLYYVQQEQQQQLMADNSQLRPGINPSMANVKGQVPVKLTNVSLGSFTERTPWSGTLQFDPSILTAAEDKVVSVHFLPLARKAKVSQNSNTPRLPNQNFHIQTTYANQSGQGTQAKGSYYGDGSQQNNPFSRTNKK